MSSDFQFGKYTVRRVDEGDREFLEDLIEKDQYHATTLTADDFLKLSPGQDAWAIENERGYVVLYFKTATAVRLIVQFGEETAEKNREVLTLGLPWLESLLAANGFHELIFDTEGPDLQAMAKRRLGFKQKEELTKQIRPMGALPSAPEEASQPEQPTDDAEGNKGLWHIAPQAGGEVQEGEDVRLK